MMEVVADVELRFISISTGNDIKKKITKRITVTANGSSDVADGITDNLSAEPHLLAARLWIDGICVSRDMDWPQPLKYLSFEDGGLRFLNMGMSCGIRRGNQQRDLILRSGKGFW
jgi:beta-mannosidase